MNSAVILNICSAYINEGSQPLCPSTPPPPAAQNCWRPLPSEAIAHHAGKNTHSPPPPLITGKIRYKNVWNFYKYKINHPI